MINSTSTVYIIRIHCTTVLYYWTVLLYWTTVLLYYWRCSVRWGKTVDLIIICLHLDIFVMCFCFAEWTGGGGSGGPTILCVARLVQPLSARYPFDAQLTVPSTRNFFLFFCFGFRLNFSFLFFRIRFFGPSVTWTFSLWWKKFAKMIYFWMTFFVCLWKLTAAQGKRR